MLRHHLLSRRLQQPPPFSPYFHSIPIESADTMIRVIFSKHTPVPVASHCTKNKIHSSYHGLWGIIFIQHDLVGLMLSLQLCPTTLPSFTIFLAILAFPSFLEHVKLIPASETWHCLQAGILSHRPSYGWCLLRWSSLTVMLPSFPATYFVFIAFLTPCHCPTFLFTSYSVLLVDMALALSPVLAHRRHSEYMFMFMNCVSVLSEVREVYFIHSAGIYQPPAVGQVLY